MTYQVFNDAHFVDSALCGGTPLSWEDGRGSLPAYPTLQELTDAEIPDAPTAPSGTTGTTPVTNATQLQAMSGSGSYILSNNIDLSGVSWTPIVAFSGVLDGNGKTISNLTIDTFSNYQGLFEELADGAEVHDLTMSNCNVTSTSSSGNISVLCSLTSGTITLKDITIDNCTINSKGDTVGFLVAAVDDLGGTQIYNCSVTDSDITDTGSSSAEIGTLFGLYELDYSATVNTSIVNCSTNNCTITLGDYSGEAGGFVGNWDGGDKTDVIRVTCYDCWSNTDITGAHPTDVGGFVGYVWGLARCVSCYATGDITLTGFMYDIGGFIGAETTFGTYINCYATGDLTLGDSGAYAYYVGGFVGLADYTDLTYYLRCYATGDITITVGSTGKWEGVGGWGGFVAQSETSTDSLIERCWSEGDITIDNERDFFSTYKGAIGGFVGALDGNASTKKSVFTIQNCYSWSQIISANPDDSKAKAGFIGSFDHDSTAKLVVTNCYSAQTDVATGSGLTDQVPSGTYGKGHIAYELHADTATDTNTFWDTETSGLDTSLYGTGHITTWMMTQSNYEDAGWDFSSIWQIPLFYKVTQKRNLWFPSDYCHLKGETVKKFVDGVILDDEVVPESCEVVGADGDAVHIGLAFTYKLKPMRLVFSARKGTNLGSIKHLNEMVVNFLDTLNAKYGKDTDNLYDIMWASASEFFSGDYTVALDSGFGKDDDVLISGDDPVPCTVRAMIPRVDVTGR